MKIILASDYYVETITSAREDPNLQNHFHKLVLRAKKNPRGLILEIQGIKHGINITLKKIMVCRLKPSFEIFQYISFQSEDDDIKVTVSIPDRLERKFKIPKDILAIARKIEQKAPFVAPVQIPKWKIFVWKMQSKNRLFKAILTKLFKV